MNWLVGRQRKTNATDLTEGWMRSSALFFEIYDTLKICNQKNNFRVFYSVINTDLIKLKWFFDF